MFFASEDLGQVYVHLSALCFQCQNNLKSTKEVYHVNLQLLIRQLALFSYAELNEKERTWH
jgi:hypothetical protein